MAHRRDAAYAPGMQDAAPAAHARGPAAAASHKHARGEVCCDGAAICACCGASLTRSAAAALRSSLLPRRSPRMLHRRRRHRRFFPNCLLRKSAANAAICCRRSASSHRTGACRARCNGRRAFSRWFQVARRRSELSAASGANCAGVPRGRRPRDDVVMRTSSSRVVVAKMAGQLLTRVPRGGASRVCAQWESFIAHTACPSAADAQRFCYPRVARPRLTRVHAAGGGAKSILTGGYAVFLTMRFKRPHLRAGRHAMCASRARRPCVGRARREFGRRGKQAMHLHRRCEMRTHEAASASRCGLALRTQPLLRL